LTTIQPYLNIKVLAQLLAAPLHMFKKWPNIKITCLTIVNNSTHQKLHTIGTCLTIDNNSTLYIYIYQKLHTIGICLTIDNNSTLYIHQKLHTIGCTTSHVQKMTKYQNNMFNNWQQFNPIYTSKVTYYWLHHFTCSKNDQNPK
jgi:hypothetical protein